MLIENFRVELYHKVKIEKTIGMLIRFPKSEPEYSEEELKKAPLKKASYIQNLINTIRSHSHNIDYQPQLLQADEQADTTINFILSYLRGHAAFLYSYMREPYQELMKHLKNNGLKNMIYTNTPYYVTTDFRFKQLILLNDNDTLYFNHNDFDNIDIKSKSMIELPRIYAIMLDRLLHPPVLGNSIIAKGIADIYRALINLLVMMIKNKPDDNTLILWHNAVIFYIHYMLNSHVIATIKATVKNKPITFTLKIGGNLFKIKSIQSVINYCTLSIARIIAPTVKENKVSFKYHHDGNSERFVHNHVETTIQITLNADTMLILSNNTPLFYRLVMTDLSNLFFSILRFASGTILHGNKTGFYFNFNIARFQ